MDGVRLLSISRRASMASERDRCPSPESQRDSENTCPQPRLSRRRSKLCRLVVFILAVGVAVNLAAFGFIHLVLVGLGHHSFTSALYTQRVRGCTPAGGVFDLTRPTEDVIPVPCHSHNDYWREKPLFDALHAGCTSVEADIWLDEVSGDLRVGHKSSTLSGERTLSNMYLEPLLELLQRANAVNGTSQAGVFSTSPNQTLTLLLDFKTDPEALLPQVEKQLDVLRERGYLSHADGLTHVQSAITVVVTGNIPDSLMHDSSPFRTLFIDAPMDTLDASAVDKATVQDPMIDSPGMNFWNSSIAYYASTSFRKSIGLVKMGELSDKQLRLVRTEIAAAKKLGLKARYWDTPSWPISLRNYIWQTLVDEGADVLNVDDLCAASCLDWSAVPHRLADG